VGKGVLSAEIGVRTTFQIASPHSLERYAAGLYHGRPVIDFAFYKRLEISGRPQLGSDRCSADFREPLGGDRRIQSPHGGVIELLHNGVGSILWKEERCPEVGIDPGNALLLGCPQLGKQIRALVRQQRNRFGVAVVDGARGSCTGRTKIIDPATDQVLQGVVLK